MGTEERGEGMTTYELRGLGAISDINLGDDRDSGPNENLHIDFPNGVRLSLVYGWGAYAGPDTVEVAVLIHKGEWLTQEVAKVAFGDNLDDNVDGFCDADRVHGYFLAAQGWPAVGKRA